MCIFAQQIYKIQNGQRHQPHQSGVILPKIQTTDMRGKKIRDFAIRKWLKKMQGEITAEFKAQVALVAISNQMTAS